MIDCPLTGRACDLTTCGESGAVHGIPVIACSAVPPSGAIATQGVRTYPADVMGHDFRGGFCAGCGAAQAEWARRPLRLVCPAA